MLQSTHSINLDHINDSVNVSRPSAQLRPRNLFVLSRQVQNKSKQVVLTLNARSRALAKMKISNVSNISKLVPFSLSCLAETFQETILQCISLRSLAVWNSPRCRYQAVTRFQKTQCQLGAKGMVKLQTQSSGEIW